MSQRWWVIATMTLMIMLMMVMIIIIIYEDDDDMMMIVVIHWTSKWAWRRQATIIFSGRSPRSPTVNPSCVIQDRGGSLLLGKNKSHQPSRNTIHRYSLAHATRMITKPAPSSPLPSLLQCRTRARGNNILWEGIGGAGGRLRFGKKKAASLCEQGVMVKTQHFPLVTQKR